MNDKPLTVRDFREDLLKAVIGHAALCFDRIDHTESKDRAEDLLYHLFIGGVVVAYQGDRFLKALAEHAPHVVDEVVADVAAALEDGSTLAEYADDEATRLGLDPSQWGREMVAWVRSLNLPAEARS